VGGGGVFHVRKGINLNLYPTLIVRELSNFLLLIDSINQTPYYNFEVYVQYTKKFCPYYKFLVNRLLMEFDPSLPCSQDISIRSCPESHQSISHQNS